MMALTPWYDYCDACLQVRIYAGRLRQQRCTVKFAVKLLELIGDGDSVGVEVLMCLRSCKPGQSAVFDKRRSSECYSADDGAGEEL